MEFLTLHFIATVTFFLSFGLCPWRYDPYEDSNYWIWFVLLGIGLNIWLSPMSSWIIGVTWIFIGIIIAVYRIYSIVNENIKTLNSVIQRYCDSRGAADYTQLLTQCSFVSHWHILQDEYAAIYKDKSTNAFTFKPTSMTPVIHGPFIRYQLGYVLWWPVRLVVFMFGGFPRMIKNKVTQLVTKYVLAKLQVLK